MTVPSRVVTITTRLSASVARPETDRSSAFRFEEDAVARRFSDTSSGQGPRLNDFRLMPDCILYMQTVPVDDALRPKLPHAVTQTAYETYVS